MKICKHFFVSGKVQGVFFRDTTRKKATELSLSGWVSNLNDGRVEVFACGSEENIAEFSKWLWLGPPAAKVTEVIEEGCDVEDHIDFVIRF